MAPGGTDDNVTISAVTSPQDETAVAASDRTRGNLLRVTAQHTQRVLVPLFPQSTFALSATASMVIE